MHFYNFFLIYFLLMNDIKNLSLSIDKYFISQKLEKK